MTRYITFRKYAERDHTVTLVWAAVTHHMSNENSGMWRWIPKGVALRLFVLAQTMPVLKQLNKLDAVMVHLFEADFLLSMRRCFLTEPILFSSTDEAPMVDRANYPLYPNDLKKPVWRQKLRLMIDLWRVRHTDQFIPFSAWAGNILKVCGAPQDKVHPIHVGLDLEIWPRVPRNIEAQSPRRVKLLFVGGDFERKGGKLLLNVFERSFFQCAELHLVSPQVPRDLSPYVYAYRDYGPNDERLKDLYADCDILAIPTSADTGPLWVFLEAMASGMPVIGTDTGSNAELVRHGLTGLVVPVGDADALEQAIQMLIDNPIRREEMGRTGRELVELSYNAATNVPQILKLMKSAVDAKRGLFEH